MSGGVDARLLVQIKPPHDGDEEELAELALLLREDLLELDVAAVDPVAAEDAPERSKAGLGVVAGWLAVNLGKPMLASVVARVVAWATRHNRTVELELGGDVLKVTGVGRDEQKRLIDEWLARQGSSA